VFASATAFQQPRGDQLFLSPWRWHSLDKLLNVTDEVLVANLAKIVGKSSPTQFDFPPCPDKRAFAGYFSGHPRPRSWMIGGQSSCSIYNGSGSVFGASGESLRPSRTSRTVSREQPSARAISHSPRPSDSCRRISSNRRTVMLRTPIPPSPSCGPTKVAVCVAGTLEISTISTSADHSRASLAPKTAPRRWSPTEEIVHPIASNSVYQQRR
jgi:hypothetical protein